MPYQIKFKDPPAGYAISAARKDEETSVQTREFTSSEDGQHFIQRLEGLPSDILSRLSPPLLPSVVDHLLAVIWRDGSTTVYINELESRQSMQVRRDMDAGCLVMKDDIVDMGRLDLGVQIPDDAGFVYVFSVGWRKGLFYDLGPSIGRDPQRRQFDVGEALGQAVCHVQFQERFSITEEEWKALFEAKWFPFAGLLHNTIDSLLAYVRTGWNPDDLLEKIDSEIRSRSDIIVKAWANRSAFAPHIEILKHAVERFQNQDYVSCTGLLFPRIEGILRTHHAILSTENHPTPKNLAEVAVGTRANNTKSLLLPHRFAEYLRTVYFASFDPKDQNINISRHSVAHGVAAAAEFNQKSAIIGILVAHQLFYFLES